MHRTVWALYYFIRHADLISLGCIHLPVALNCAWGVLYEGPDLAANVVNLRKVDTEEDVYRPSVMQWANRGHPLF